MIGVTTEKKKNGQGAKPALSVAKSVRKVRNKVSKRARAQLGEEELGYKVASGSGW
jgi:hypothetical protein